MQIPLGITNLTVLTIAMAVSIFVGLKAAGKNNSVVTYLLSDRNLTW